MASALPPNLGAFHEGTAIELAGVASKGLLSPTLSSRGGEGEKTGDSFGKWLNSMAVAP